MKLLIFFICFFSSNVWADDCNSIRKDLAALPTAGGKVRIKSGTYVCTEPIVIEKSHVRLTGDGAVVIRLADHIHAPLLIVGDPKTVFTNGEYLVGHRVSDIEISNLSLDGNRMNHDVSKECGEKSCDGDATSVRNNGLTIRGASFVKITNIKSHGMISGGIVTEKYCDHIKIDRAETYDNFFDGFAGCQTKMSEISRLYSHDNLAAGISIDINFNKNLFRDSRLDSNHSVGIFARHVHDDIFRRIDIERSKDFGIFLAADQNECADDNQFDSVSIHLSGRSGLRVNDACRGNRVIGSSNLCRNKDGPTSEIIKGSLQVDSTVACQ